MQVPAPSPEHFLSQSPVTDERRAIIDAVEAARGPVGPKAIADATGLPPASVRNMMPEMARAGQIEKVHRGTYAAVSHDGDDVQGVPYEDAVAPPLDRAAERRRLAGTDEPGRLPVVASHVLTRLSEGGQPVFEVEVLVRARPTREGALSTSAERPRAREAAPTS